MRCEKLILLDPELSTKQNVEQMLWKSVFHHMVELIRRQLAEDHAEETRVSLNKILDEVCTPLCNLYKLLSVNHAHQTCRNSLTEFILGGPLPVLFLRF